MKTAFKTFILKIKNIKAIENMHILRNTAHNNRELNGFSAPVVLVCMFV